MLRSIIRVQTCIRLWLAIKQHQRKKDNLTPGVTSVQIVQAAIHKYGAQRDFIDKLQKMFIIDHQFASFLGLLKETKGENSKCYI